MNIDIRQGHKEDSPAIAQLGALVFAATYSAALAPDVLALYLARSFSARALGGELADASNRFLLAYRGPTLVGYARLAASPPPACVQARPALELATLYVDPALHGAGVGNQLMAACLAAAAQGGYGGLWLCVWEHNARARRFYERQGCVAVGSTTIIVGPTLFHDLVLECAVRS
jgi:ribosomal protein S18 acetylase RimI-like enzyme